MRYKRNLYIAEKCI